MEDNYHRPRGALRRPSVTGTVSRLSTARVVGELVRYHYHGPMVHDLPYIVGFLVVTNKGQGAYAVA